jgi:hypothetical protein
LVLAAADIIIIRHDDVELIVYNEAQLCCFCCLLDPACEISSNTQSQRGKKEKREKDNEILFFSFFFCGWPICAWIIIHAQYLFDTRCA